MLPGQIGTGGSLSLTMTWKLQLALFPEVSVAVQSTVVLPLGKIDPEAGEQTTVELPWVSVAVTINETTFEHKPGNVLVRISDGQWITGGVVSGIIAVLTTFALALLLVTESRVVDETMALLTRVPAIVAVTLTTMLILVIV